MRQSQQKRQQNAPHRKASGQVTIGKHAIPQCTTLSDLHPLFWICMFLGLDLSDIKNSIDLSNRLKYHDSF